MEEDIKSLEKRITKVERIVLGDESLRVKSLRAEVENLSKVVGQLQEYLNRAKWFLTIIGGVGGIQAIDLIRSIIGALTSG